ncbi:MAG: valine--tRNA ligase, partial [Alphaproteobacteria bacterium]|nr:valine--tRNA ligase [Alphaproteobacteria bacterium]
MSDPTAGDLALDKTFDPKAIEARQYPRMVASGAFRSDPSSTTAPFCIMMPPPNVTGVLHMGHAFTMTLQDVLTRYRRAQGRDALWQPGTDHAGIATQMVVERQLAEQGLSRQGLGREAFLERVWDWKATSGGTIVEQLKRLGASCDWERERFTMDEGLSRAVVKVFVDLYRAGLIYKDKRLVNWDPKLHTAISDLEVEQREVKGHLWYIRYAVEGTDRTITVATTRPETMLGDTGIAVHPEDERYADLIGRHAILPLAGRRIPIVADLYSDPTKGSGAVKITPAHDFNDFEVGRRHDLARINILDRDAKLTLADNAAFLAGLPPEGADLCIRAFHGHDRAVVRTRIVEMLTEAECLEKIEPHTHQVPHGDRSGVVIEPWLTDQWYCDAATLAKGPIEAVETGRTVFVPKSWENTFFDWMRNIQPWCISRQLWWGHQIPAWYGPDGTVFVAADEAEAQSQATAHYGQPAVLERDP